MRLRAATFALALLVLPSCTTAQQQAEPTEPDPAMPMDTITGTGTIRYQDIAGGFYGIVGDDGKRYDPGTLDEAFQQDGLRVKFVLRRLEGVMSMRMWGIITEVVSLEAI